LSEGTTIAVDETFGWAPQLNKYESQLDISRKLTNKQRVFSTVLAGYSDTIFETAVMDPQRSYQYLTRNTFLLTKSVSLRDGHYNSLGNQRLKLKKNIYIILKEKLLAGDKYEDRVCG
jgi:hypothetical protein